MNEGTRRKSWREFFAGLTEAELLRIAEEEEAYQREIAHLLARVDRAALDSRP